MTVSRPTSVAKALLVLLASTASTGGVNGASHSQKPVGDGLGATTASKDPFTNDFSQYIDGVLKEWKTPGMSIAVVDGDNVYAKGYGFAELPNTPATPETLWYGGSTTKAFVGATLAHFIGNGSHESLENGWNTPISSIIRDDFVLQDEWSTKHLTLEDAVSHRTGMLSHDLAWPRVRDDNGRPIVKDTVRKLRHLSLSAPPRVVNQYCNLMYVTLGHVLETISGKWLGDLLRDTIWGPLDMNSTYFGLADAKNHAKEPIAKGYYWDFDTEKFGEVKEDIIEDAHAAGAIVSNVLDYAKWVKCLMGETEPLSTAVHKDIRTPRALYSTTPDLGMDVMLYGLGWIRTVFHGKVVYMHSGGTAAFGAQVFWLPEVNYSVVSFGNVAGLSNAAEQIITYRLIEDKLGVPQDERKDWTDRLWKPYKSLFELFDNAVEILYPNRPKEAVPPSQNASQLVGKYYDPGYGTLDFTEETDPKNKDSTVLVAKRGDMVLMYGITLKHVSGDYWVGYFKALEGWQAGMTFVAAEFKIGVDGKATGLEVKWQSKTDDLWEVKTLFKKVE